ncbi:hypothetical protein NPIL_248221 [Nephila pilipes]|uniref:Uncharacterized protein n=1 Tax=Nephila pilipes TaxID=299642 RepID=A0A8X6PKA0_NEPPI|nr:hypothetical protein NPIL_248221 [Nephila pilipes]
MRQQLLWVGNTSSNHDCSHNELKRNGDVTLGVFLSLPANRLPAGKMIIHDLHTVITMALANDAQPVFISKPINQHREECRRVGGREEKYLSNPFTSLNPISGRCLSLARKDKGSRIRESFDGLTRSVTAGRRPSSFVANSNR